uniref:Uncharacterized protein n=1 Tax=Angiostrongylus cantonensis TaxID=6313 RepID=A0A158P6K4_ANGCA
MPNDTFFAMLLSMIEHVIPLQMRRKMTINKGCREVPKVLYTCSENLVHNMLSSVPVLFEWALILPPRSTRNSYDGGRNEIEEIPLIHEANARAPERGGVEVGDRRRTRSAGGHALPVPSALQFSVDTPVDRHCPPRTEPLVASVSAGVHRHGVSCVPPDGHGGHLPPFTSFHRAFGQNSRKNRKAMANVKLAVKKCESMSPFPKQSLRSSCDHLEHYVTANIKTISTD